MTDDSPFDPFDEEVRQNLEHLAMLRRGPEVWSKWRAKNQHVKIVLKGANLSNADLRHVDLTYANLEGADLTQTDLTGANLIEAVLTGVRFRGANLTEAYFIRADLSGAKLAESLHLSQERIEAANGNWLTSLPPGLTYPDHWDKEPQKDGPNPEHLAILRQGVEVWNRWWEENPNIRPNLTGADLSGADLRGYNLRLSILRKAKLGGADLNGADLTYANISMTDLSESLHLTQNQIDDAYGNRLTLLPPGLIHPEHWEKGRSSFADYFFKPLPESEDQPNPKSPLPNIQYPFPMAWNAEGKITVVPPQERPPAHGLSPATRDLLAQALIDAATDLASHVLESNGDRRIAEKLQSYAREAAKGGAELNILRLDAIVRTLRNLAARDEDAFSPIVAAEFEVFTGDHDRLTRFYPDFEDYQRALDLTTDNIPAPPDIDLAKIMREPPGPEVFDSSVAEAIDDVLPQLGSPGTPDPRNDKRWRYAFFGVLIALKKLFDDAPQNLIKVVAVQQIYLELTPIFESLISFFDIFL